MVAGADTKLFVTQYPYEYTNKDIEKLFGNYGKIVDVQLKSHSQHFNKGHLFLHPWVTLPCFAAEEEPTAADTRAQDEMLRDSEHC